MPRRASKSETDPNKIAFRVVQESLRDTEGTAEEAEERRKRSDLARALGALGASKGGKARAAALTKAEKVKIAQKAAAARWQKRPEENK